MFWHVDTDAVCLVIIFTLYLGMRKKYYAVSKQDHLFRIITLVSIICIAIDIIASAIMEPTVAPNVAWGLYQFVLVVYYVSLAAMPLMWFYYAALTSFQNINKRFYTIIGICSIPAIAYIFAVLSSPWSHVIFSLSKDSVYTRGSAFYLTVIIYALYTVLTIAVLLLRIKYIRPKAKVFLVLICPIIVSICIAIQLSTNVGLLLINAGYTISYVITYAYIEDSRFSLDGLTNVLVRGSGEKKINELIMSCSPGSRAAMILMDVDNFKHVNDTLGHLAGDEVLKSIAAITKSVIDKNTIVSRFGGDEFVIFTTDFISMDNLHEKIDIFFSRISNDMNYGEGIRPQRPVTVSLGIALYKDNGTDFISLYKCADVALQYAKRNGKNAFEFYNPDMDDIMNEELPPVTR